MSTRALFCEIIDLAFSVSANDSLRGALANVVRRYGYENFAYLSLNATSANSFAVSNYPEQWQSIYFGRSYMIVDPVVTMGKRLMRAFPWSVDRQRKVAGDDEKGFWDNASDFGIRAGLTIPIPCEFGQVAMLTFAAATDLGHAQFAEADATIAAATVAHLHSRLTNTDRPTRLREPGLTDREVLCLRWLAAGKPKHEIALLTGLTYHTIRFDIENARAKLGARNGLHAVAIATALRLI
ncbi:autoinducer binding domain-containing protein [Rhizobium cauense]|uniref:autoinducer binding domain-containing protein n=1 Tax=Rhizobium cauense TaxID=1166683 RepID=UPI001C6ECBE8|nr:autoinducer binding domain-containing protein [Rhizobium cauense]MBW9117969.1 autoinducer binding domain-containing protein [Rhizobium cauense]